MFPDLYGHLYNFNSENLITIYIKPYDDNQREKDVLECLLHTSFPSLNLPASVEL